VKHLAVGTALVIGVGLSIFTFRQSLLAMVASALLFGASFMLHELAHKAEAQRHGLWAEFRINLQSALITLISIIAPFKLIAPGAVIVAGSATPSIMARIALVGPLVNLVLGGVLYTLALITPGMWHLVLVSGAYVNAILAVFNLIPFSILDGRKLFTFDRRRWIKVFTASIVLFALVIWSFFLT